LPAGTENVFAKNYGYLADADSLMRCLTHGRIRSVDMATANDQCFLVMAGAGFDAEAVARLSRSRRGHISYLSYVVPLWRTYWEYRFPPLRVLADGELVFDGRGLVLVGNLPRYAMGLRILRDARDDDGLLDLCAFACRSQARLLVHAAVTLARRHVTSRGVVYRRAREIQIESPERVPFQIDGDLAGHLPARLAAVPRAALLCLPA
jgi:diacylglycerol kinase family enzyme